jgi:plastocyanin
MLALALAGCSSSPAPSSAPTTAAPTTAPTTAATTGATGGGGGGGAAGHTVTIQNFAFSPATLSVAPGTTITVVNKDSTTHTLTSTSSPAAFNTGDIGAGATVTFKAPSKAGSYAYICTIHTFMHGTLTVQ